MSREAVIPRNLIEWTAGAAPQTPPNPNQQDPIETLLRERVFTPGAIRMAAGSGDIKFINPNTANFDANEVTQAIVTADKLSLLPPIGRISKADREHYWTDDPDRNAMHQGHRRKKWRDEMEDYIRELRVNHNNEGLGVFKNNFGIDPDLLGGGELDRKRFRYQLEQFRKKYLRHTDTNEKYNKHLNAFLEDFSRGATDLPSLARRFTDAEGILGVWGEEDTVRLLKLHLLSRIQLQYELTSVLFFSTTGINQPLPNETSHALQRLWIELGGDQNQQPQQQTGPTPNQPQTQPPGPNPIIQPGPAGPPHHAPIAPAIYDIHWFGKRDDDDLMFV